MTQEMWYNVHKAVAGRPKTTKIRAYPTQANTISNAEARLSVGLCALWLLFPIGEGITTGRRLTEVH